MSLGNIAPIRRARKNDPATSKAAARNADRFSESHAGRILAALNEGPRSAHGISAMTGLSVVQVDRRLPELARAGKAQVLKAGGADVVVGGYRVWVAV